MTRKDSYFLYKLVDIVFQKAMETVFHIIFKINLAKRLVCRFSSSVYYKIYVNKTYENDEFNFK